MALLSSETPDTDTDPDPDLDTVKELFFEACDYHNLSDAEDALTLGADVNWRDARGWAGLHIAAAENYRSLLELLLAQAGVDVNIEISGSGATPLMIACQEGHEKILRRLSQVSGVQINAKDVDGSIPLHWAVNQNHSACISVLREVAMAGVDWNAKSNAGDYSLADAVNRSQAECLKIIMSVSEPYLDLSVTDQEGRYITQIAVENPQYGESQRCLELLSEDRRVDPYWNVKNADGDSPVMICFKNDRINMATTLLANTSVDLDTVDSEGKHLEDIARERNMTTIQGLLWTFRSVQRRMILKDNHLSREAGRVFSLQRLSRDAIVISLANNSQERLVRPLVDRLEGKITGDAKNQLQTSYSEIFKKLK